MQQATFQLHPFSPTDHTAQFNIFGTVTRHCTRLDLAFQLTGPIHDLGLPTVHSRPRRMDGLWAHTCFECFLGAQHGPVYWEFNLSPAGHWNAYRFDDYRQGMQPEWAYEALPAAISSGHETLALTVGIDLKRIHLAGQPIRLALSAVLAAQGDLKTYWALTHGAPQPDFHHPSGFLMAL